LTGSEKPRKRLNKKPLQKKRHSKMLKPNQKKRLQRYPIRKEKLRRRLMMPKKL